MFELGKQFKRFGNISINTGTNACIAGCVDVTDMKVLRDASGCHFDIPFVLDLTWTQLENQLPAESHIFLADSLASAVNENEPSVVDYSELKYADCSHIVLVMGGETEGLSRSVCRLYNSSQWPVRRIHIPMFPGIDSLNSAVSASIILCEMRRQIAPVTDDAEIHQLD